MKAKKVDGRSSVAMKVTKKSAAPHERACDLLHCFNHIFVTSQVMTLEGRRRYGRYRTKNNGKNQNYRGCGVECYVRKENKCLYSFSLSLLVFVLNRFIFTEITL